MHDDLHDDELRAFRASFQKFITAEILPHHARWRDAGVVDRAVFAKAGAAGFLCITQGADYGGLGLDFRYSAVVAEELSAYGCGDVFFSLHSDIVAPYIEHNGTDAQKQRWLPGMASGSLIGAIAMTEPGTGSDLQAIATTAKDAGDHWVIDGNKTFISNGLLADVVIVAVRVIDDAGAAAEGWQSLSLIVVERDTPGFVRGKQLKKVGLKAQDTCELHFSDCRVPKEYLLGERGQGFIYLMNELARERLVVAVGCVAGARAALNMTIEYVKDRKAFGKPLSKQQNTRFQIAEMATEVEVGEAFVDRCIVELNKGTLTPAKASMAKAWTSEMVGRVVDACVQLYGGYGFMEEYPIARAWTDARVQRIYAGTTEIMKEIVARSLL
jgi:alkylation response protein AidB-like acyl-CoA dehydrogenase